MKKLVIIMAFLCAVVLHPPKAHAVITLVSHGLTNCSAGANDCATGNFTAGSGNLLIFACNNTSGTDAATVSDTLSQTFTSLYSVKDTVRGSDWYQVWYVKNSASGTDSINCHNATTGTSLQIIWLQYSGVDTASPLDGTNGGVNGDGTGSCASGNITTTNANDVLVSIEMGNQWGGTYTSTSVTSGFTIIDNDTTTGHHGVSADNIVSTAGTYQCTTTKNGGGGENHFCSIQAFKEAMVDKAPSRRPFFF